MKTVKMLFTRDTFYSSPDKPDYLAGKTYDIPENLIFKWLKRGAQIVDEPVKAVGKKPAVIKPAVQSPPAFLKPADKKPSTEE